MINNNGYINNKNNGNNNNNNSAITFQTWTDLLKQTREVCQIGVLYYDSKIFILIRFNMN